MTHQPPPPTPTATTVPVPDAALIDEIHDLLAVLQSLRRRHQQELDEHRNADGEVIEEQYAAYEETRTDTAIEASDALETVTRRLELLAATPVRRAFTVTLTGPGYDEGEAPWLFVVNATGLDDAHQTLTRLPSFQRWLAGNRTAQTPAPAVDLLADESHPGVRAPGTYNDLRNEQAALTGRTAASHSAPATAPPTPGPPSTARPHTR
ncbi:hypothetical protein ACFU99_30885 [Streptomyces sp. NPDC057654]|uniref:hypothetical protein n=1 Tax=Streptomyces sp. NPDC057654 TaxID=3346196 RepID=UPI003694D1D2